MIRHVINVRDFSPEDLNSLFQRTTKLKSAYKNRKDWVSTQGQLLTGQILVSLFYEPSTRTRLSFESAMNLLGGRVIGTENAREFSSEVKGETLEDSIRIIGAYGDVIILRHYEVGAAARAASVSAVPIVNAGDGDGEHPTQALLDLYTIREALPRRNDLTVTFVGDLKNGRTVHSLAHLFGQTASCELATVSHINFIGPESFQIPEAVTGYLKKFGVSFEVHVSLTPEVLATSDIVYMTRPQLERSKSEKDRERAVESLIDGKLYTLTPKLADCLKKSAIIMHPFPRNKELPEELDVLPQARYFEQAGNGLYVRMALLLDLLEK